MDFKKGRGPVEDDTATLNQKDEQEQPVARTKKFEPIEMEVLVSHDAKKQSWISYCVAVASLCLFAGMFYIVGVAYLVCFYQIIVNGSLVAMAAVTVLLASSFYPSTILCMRPFTHDRSTNSFPLGQGFIDWWVWQTQCEYFSFTVKVPKIRENYSPDGRYMFVGKDGLDIVCCADMPLSQ